MIRHAWLSLVIACFIQGIATAISPYAGMFAGVCIGTYLAARLWYVDHPVTWRYDLAFWITLVSVATLAAGVNAVVCSLLPITGWTTRACRSLSLERVVWLHLWMICLVAGILWLYGRLRIWWGLRRHR